MQVITIGAPQSSHSVLKDFFTKRNVVKLIKATIPLASGLFDSGKELTSNAYYTIKADKKINSLVSELGLKNKKFNLKKIKLKDKHPFMDAYVISGLTPLEMTIEGVPSDVENAYMFAFPQQALETSFIDAWEQTTSYEERLGFVSAIKGKLFEVKYTDYLNSNLESGYSAAMASSPNQQGWDIKIQGPDKEVVELLQLKATNSASYVNDAIKKYPEIDIVSISDLQGQLALVSPDANVTLSSISNNDLLTEIIAETDKSSFLFFPAIPLLSLGFIVFDSYRMKDLSEYEKKHSIGKRGGDLFVNSSIIVSTTPFIGIPLVIGKEILFSKTKKKRLLIQFLKDQIKKQKKSEKVWDKQVSRRSFLKGLSAAAILSAKPKRVI